VRTINRTPWIACFVLIAAASGTVTIAGTGSQAATQSNPQQQQQQQTDEQRKQILQKLLQDIEKGAQGQAAAQAPAQAPAQNPAPPATPSPAAAQRAAAAGDQIKLNFDNAPLYDLINQIADLLDISPILIDPDIKGNVTFHSTIPVSIKQDVLPIFNLILKSNNAALVKSGQIYKIVPISQGLKEGLEVVESLPPVPPAKPAADKVPEKKAEAVAGDTTTAATPPPNGGRQGGAPPAAPPQAPSQPPANPPAQSMQTALIPHLVTEVIRVEFVPVTTLVEPLRLFMTEGGVIMPYDRQNMLIITDYSDSIQKLTEIVHLLDSGYLDSDLIELVEIKNNLSADVLDDLKKVFGNGTKDSATGVNMISFDRMNAILVMTNSKRALEEVKRWIAKLDTTVGRSIQTFIYTVENSTASNIAQVLGLLFAGDTGNAQGGNQQGGVGGASGTNQRNAGTTPYNSANRTNTSMQGTTMSQGLNTQNPYGAGAGMTGMGNTGGIAGGGQNPIGGPRLNQQPTMSAQVLTAGQFSGLQGAVRIVADDVNNSLIVQGSPADYELLLKTIQRMDVLPRQAIIEARIFEIDLTNDLSFGVSATLGAVQSGQQLTTGAIDATTGALSASSFAFIGSSREILANLTALRSKTKVKILEAPAVLAIDGQMAHIQVGGQVPIPGSSYTSAVGNTTSVNYANTGTELEITPRISASGTVTLDVSQSVTSEGTASSLGPTFNTTNVITTLAVKDGESVAIAGLIRENESTGHNGVPFLSDIPVLGALFGQRTRNTSRTELLIMITPHVIRTPERFAELTDQLKDSLRNVGKYADQKQQEIKKDQEKSEKDRLDSQGKPIKKSDQSVSPPAPVKKESEPVAYGALQPRRDRA
jgi:general secretion pathway protein D